MSSRDDKKAARKAKKDKQKALLEGREFEEAKPEKKVTERAEYHEDAFEADDGDHDLDQFAVSQAGSEQSATVCVVMRGRNIWICKGQVWVALVLSMFMISHHDIYTSSIFRLTRTMSSSWTTSAFQLVARRCFRMRRSLLPKAGGVYFCS